MDMNLLVRKKNKGYQYVISYKEGLTWRQTSKQGFATKGEAKRAGQARMRELEELNPSPDSDVTFGDVAKMVENNGNLSDNTKRMYKYWASFYDEIKGMPIRLVRYNNLIDIITDHSKKYKYSGTKDMVGHGRRIMNFAQKKLRIISYNPFDDIEVKKPVVSDKRSPVALTAPQINELITRLSGGAQLLTAIMGLCGLRIGEARGLTWKDIDFQKSLIHVKQQRDEIGKRKTLKTRNSYRSVPLPKKIRELLSELPVPIDQDNYLVGKVILTRDLYKAYTSIRFDILPHDLRHSFATNCISKGLDFKTTAQMLGDSVGTVLSTYVHVNQDMEDEARRIIESF